MMRNNSRARKLKASTLKQWLSMVLVAIMLGFSNVILEEDRSVNDTKVRIEIVEALSEEGVID
ncbi:hypothetical protein [Croceitalea sp. MTPC5]|uniref:hypothetical protein n=1 Tax=Croceitalea sp. MTPC5 TaxID=3056565 RepID=UPI0030D25C34